MVDYKLRLGDGTTFSVDEKGLTTWLQGGLVDDKARVQPAGSKKWFTLKQVLAAQGTQRGHAVRQTEQGRADVDRQAAEETAEIERKVAEQRAAEERKAAEEQRKAAEELAAAERKRAADRNAAERKLIQDREDAERRAAEERAEAEAAAKARAEAERQAEQERLEAERRAGEERAEAERRAAEQRAEAERAEAEAREAQRVAEAEKRVAAERAERAEKKRKAEEARLEAEQRAAEDARLAAERKAAEERAAELKKAEERAAAERREAEAREAAAREAARVAEAERQIAAERAERAERKRLAEEERAAEQRTEQDRLAQQRAAEQRAAEERLAAERRAADERLASRAAAERAAREREVSAPTLSEPPETEIAIEPAAAMVKVEDFERELGLVPVMFNDGTDPAGRRGSPDARTGHAASAPSRSESDSSHGAAAPRPFVKPPTAVDNAVLALLKILDRGVVWVVKTLAPLVGAAVARSVGALMSAGPKLKAALARRATPVEPASPYETPAAPASAQSITAPAPWAAPAPPVPPAPRNAPAPAPAAAPPPWAAPPPPPLAVSAPLKLKTTGAAPPREAAVPPPSFQKMDVIPFAAAPVEAKGDEDVWDGEDPWQEPSALSSMFSTVWVWVKRVTIVTALIVTVAVLALNKEKWLPQAEDAANVLGQNVDKLQESTRTVPPEAIAAAHGEIPYLRPATIEMIMAKSTGVLAPAEVFRRAHQAVEVARPSLPTHVAAEIDNLTTAAAAGLDGGEGEQLRGYLAALRAGTPTAAYQDKEAVWLMTRGVRRLSGEELARMQELFAQAITVALKPPAQP